MAIVRAEPVTGPRPLRWRLFLVGGSAGTLFGYSIVVSNDAIEPIRQQYSLSGWAVGTVVSSLIAGALLGCLIAGRFVERHGHRAVLGVAGVIAAAGSILSALAPNALTITTGRLILGAAVGVTTAVAPTYISEIAHPRNRGPMMAGYQFSIAFGFLMSLTVGAVLSLGEHQWRIMLAANALPALLQAATMVRVPSTPYSLIARGFIDQARESLMATRHPDEVSAELEAIVSAHQRPTQSGIGTDKTALRRPILIAVGAALMDTLVGICVIVPYSTAVFTMAGVGGRAGAEFASWSVGVVNVISTIVAAGLLSRYGRRPLLTIGLIGIIATLLAISASLIASESGYTAATTIIAMLIFMACHAFSAGPIGWLLVTEVLPTRIRSRGTGAAIGINWLANLLVALLFPVVVGSPGIPFRAGVVFLGLAGISAAFLVFVRLCVPETKGLSLAEVEAKFAGRPAIAERHDQPTS